MILTGLLGGSFNPAHRGHRQLSLAAMEALALDEFWWMVSPGNPLKRSRQCAALETAGAAARPAPSASGPANFVLDAGGAALMVGQAGGGG